MTLSSKPTKIAAVLGAALLCTCASAQVSDTLQKIKDSGVISLGGRDASFPFSYKINANSDPIGYSADLCMKIVEAVKAKLALPNLKVQYTIVTPSNRIPLVQNGTVDLECSTTTKTEARQQDVDFAPTHFVASVGAAAKKASGINTFAELGGKTVATVTGSTSIQLMRGYRRAEKTDIAEISGKDTSEAFLLLSSDRAAAMILDDVQLAGLMARSRNPTDFKILAERLRSEPYGFMLRKNDPRFKELVDQTLTGLMKSGEINEIYAKWFTRPVPPSNANLNFPMNDGTRQAIERPNNKGV
jgi:glutamate/aspartate transport system substrate-binding protein